MSRKKTYGPPSAQGPNADASLAPPAGEAESQAQLKCARASPDLDIIAIVGKERSNPMGYTTLKLAHWLGCGIDEWVWATVETLTMCLERNAGSIATLRGNGEALSKHFFRFLTEGREQPLLSEPLGFTRIHADMFIAWLKKNDPEWETRGGDGIRTNFSRSKSMVTLLHKMGLIRAPLKGLWPSNPFPGASGRRRSQMALSSTEQQRLAEALKADIVDLHFKRLEISGSEATTVHYALIAMRTGCNPTPLLEAKRDAVGDGLRQGRKVLRLAKPRASKTVEKAVRDRVALDAHAQEARDKAESAGDESDILTIPLDVVAIWRRQLAATEALRDAAPAEAKDSPWLYVSAKLNDEPGRVVRLSSQMMQENLHRIVQRRQVKGDDGKPLRLNTMRLRQSFAERAWRLSEGDPLQVAAMLGNTPRVAGMHYASITDEIVATGAAFMGEALFPTLRGVENEQKTIPIKHEPTPTASCLDPRHGDRAPKDGSLCNKFVLCLFCRSFAVVGELNELWRLFSFQVFLQAELEHLDTLHGSSPSDAAEVEDLRTIYRRAVEHIDSWPALKFGKTLVGKAKAKARAQLHPFWEIEVRRARSARRLILKASPPTGTNVAGGAV